MEVNMSSVFNSFGFHRKNLENLINENWEKQINLFNEKYFLPKDSIEKHFDFSRNTEFGRFIGVAVLEGWKEHPFFLLVQLQYSIINI